MSDVLWGLAYADGCGPGRTPEECDASKLQCRLEAKPVKSALNSHLAFMRNHPAARCFRDAYRADRAVANAYLAWMADFYPVGPDTPEGRAQVLNLEDIDAKLSTFLSRIRRYFADCE